MQEKQLMQQSNYYITICS